MDKGLRVNAGKTKIMICGTGLDLLQRSGQFPFTICHTRMGSDSIFCSGCKHWLHKKCSGLKHLTKDPDYRCTQCKGTAYPLDGDSIFCSGCKHWLHKKCSGLKHLTKDPDYRCTQCKGTAYPLDGRPQREQVGSDKLEVVASFCYLGDMLSAASGCEFSTTTHTKTTWKKFKEVLPVLSSRHVSFKTCCRIYSYFVRNTMLHASETWPLIKPNLQGMTGQ